MKNKFLGIIFGIAIGLLLVIAFTPTDTLASYFAQVRIWDGTEVANVNASNQLEVSVENAPTVDCNSSDVTVDNAAAGAAVNIQDGGNTITVDGTVTAAQATASNLKSEVHGSQGVALQQQPLSNDLIVTLAGEQVTVVGNVAHDAVDSGNPVKIGAKAIDYEPDTEDGQGFAEVATNDRANVGVNLRGEQIEGVNTLYHLFDGAFPDTGLDGRYDDDPTSSTSEAVECWNYRSATVGFSLDSTLAPTWITFQVQFTADGTNWMDLTNGPLGMWIYDDTHCATAVNEAYTFPICAYKIRIKVTVSGTNATNYFDVDNSYVQLRN